jgi:hypothetical protein
VKILEGGKRKIETCLPTQKIIHDLGLEIRAGVFRRQYKERGEGGELWSKSGDGETEKGMLCTRRFCDGLELCVVCVCMCVMLCSVRV